jgi:hypothetical protein
MQTTYFSVLILSNETLHERSLYHFKRQYVVVSFRLHVRKIMTDNYLNQRSGEIKYISVKMFRTNMGRDN